MENIKIKKIKRRYVTLIEMMIVMFLIALITGVIAYNYRGSLDEGKAFKTKAGIEKIETILNLAMADDSSLLDNIETRWKDIIRRSPLVHNSESLIKDGWGMDYRISFDQERNTVHVFSEKFEEYQKHNATMFRN